MLDAEQFVRLLDKHGISFFTGIPDSALKGLCNYLDAELDKRAHIIAANEGNAIAIATGYHLATSKIGCVYMQNSGFGNAINPLTSLTNPEVYGIPMIILIGWRGMPGKIDEPQHELMGKISEKLATNINLPLFYLNSEPNGQIEHLISLWKDSAKENSCPVIVLCEKGLFSGVQLSDPSKSTLTREKFLSVLLPKMGENDLCVSTTGKTGRELYELRIKIGGDPRQDFLVIGSMGHASSIALGIALNTDKRVVVLDGDGASIMHLGAGAVIGDAKPDNYYHIILNNGTHQSVGGQRLPNSDVDFPSLYLGMGYKEAFRITSEDEIERMLEQFLNAKGPMLLEVEINNHSRSDLGRPEIGTIERKVTFMEKINATDNS